MSVQLAGCVLVLLVASLAISAPAVNVASEKTSDGDVQIEPINHSALRFEYKGKQYYVDPAGQADWGNMPKADAIFITHEHQDHLSPDVIAKIRKDGTIFVMSAPAARKAGYGQVIKPGEQVKVLDITAEGVAAYNTSADRQQFHPKARGDVGYVMTFGDKRVYVAGDTEPTPEMKALKNIDIAFLPMNLPYTMTPHEVAEAAKAFKPKVLYPYHQGKTDLSEIKRLLANEKDIELRVLPLP